MPGRKNKENQHSEIGDRQSAIDTRQSPPAQLVRMIGGTPNIDVENRIVEFNVCTRALARDGGIVRPEGIVRKFYEQNPVVGIRHMLAGFDSPRPLVAGRALTLESTADGLISQCQFADSELGREWAYLYGVNEKKEVYMRAVSFGWSVMKAETWTLDEARQYLGSLWDEDAVPGWCRRFDEVWVSTRSEMHEYSLVEVGADRNALSRAYNDGIRTAGEIMTRLDLESAQAELKQFKTEMGAQDLRVQTLERQVKALGGKDSDAATPSNASELLQEVRSMVAGMDLRDEVQRLGKVIRQNN